LLALDGWPANVIIAGMKPSDDGKAIVLRLQEVAGKDTEVKLQWRGNPPKAVWQSNPFEEPVSRENGAINIAGKGVLTLRIDF
jgi:alpha-mannosidase